jgi:hypothetical protein
MPRQRELTPRELETLAALPVRSPLREILTVRRSQRAIDRVLQRASHASNAEVTGYPGMSYEDGVLAMYWWLTGTQDDPPLGAG